MKRVRPWLVALAVVYLSQWLYLGWVGMDTGLWDFAYTVAENKLDRAALTAPASMARFRNAAALAEALEPEDGRLGRTYHDLGALLFYAGSSREARVYLNRALRIFENSDGPGGSWVGLVEMRLAEIDIQQGRTPQGIERLRRAERILLRTQGNFSVPTIRVVVLRADAENDSLAAQRADQWIRDGKITVDIGTRARLQRLLRGQQKVGTDAANHASGTHDWLGNPPGRGSRPGVRPGDGGAGLRHRPGR